MDLIKLLEIFIFINPEYKSIFLLYCCIGAYFFAVMIKLSHYQANIKEEFKWKSSLFVGLLASMVIIVVEYLIINSYFACLYSIAILSFVTFVDFKETDNKGNT